MTTAWQIVGMAFVLACSFSIACVGAAFSLGIYQMITDRIGGKR